MNEREREKKERTRNDEEYLLRQLSRGIVSTGDGIESVNYSKAMITLSIQQ